MTMKAWLLQYMLASTVEQGIRSFRPDIYVSPRRSRFSSPVVFLYNVRKYCSCLVPFFSPGTWVVERILIAASVFGLRRSRGRIERRTVEGATISSCPPRRVASDLFRVGSLLPSAAAATSSGKKIALLAQSWRFSHQYDNTTARDNDTAAAKILRGCPYKVY